ncbi:Bgt-51174 [Blumeria graminis f. sp. tritici]|uniref:Bgt-51174 n=1 Tax=Blumeria graminis f. sp. tritici TaxID=62690 RepID=A0A9X9MJX7_BLUGR|nr:Bgt-51174 [Blumeria graminis f. sp. tritici]
MNANLVLALLSKHLHPMYIELAVVTPISPSIANLSYIPKAASLPLSYYCNNEVMRSLRIVTMGVIVNLGGCRIAL